MKRSKIADVAKMATVSKSTISNYLNGRYDNMSHTTRKRIELAINQLNYTPNISARRLSAKIPCNVVCVIIPMNIASTFETYYYPTVLSSVGNISAEKGYGILIYARKESGSGKELEYIKGMAGTIADGFMMFDLKTDDFYFQEFEKAGIPYVCVGKFDQYDSYHYVASDHKQGIVDAVDHLVSLGHSKIGILLEQGASVVSGVRKSGFAETMSKYSLPIQERYIEHIQSYTAPSGEINYQICRKIMLQKDPPTALIAPVGALLGIERTLGEEGLQMPRNLSVVALDYVDGYNLQYTNYTRVESIAHAVAETAFLKLIEYINAPKEGFHSEIVPLQFLLGETTGIPTEINANRLGAKPFFF